MKARAFATEIVLLEIWLQETPIRAPVPLRQEGKPPLSACLHCTSSCGPKEKWGKPSQSRCNSFRYLHGCRGGQPFSFPGLSRPPGNAPTCFCFPPPSQEPADLHPLLSLKEKAELDLNSKAGHPASPPQNPWPAPVESTFLAAQEMPVNQISPSDRSRLAQLQELRV